jgi:Flp pilus assembly protein TadD
MPPVAGVPMARDVVVSPPPRPSRSVAGEDGAFVEGVRLVELGAYGDATARLDAFRRGHPNDARAEDAAFLQIVALERAGRRDEARKAARRYLDAYPHGFRRTEAEALAR